MSIAPPLRTLLGPLAVAAVLLTAALLPRTEASAAGTITGNVPTDGGVALVSWSGGPTDEIIQAAFGRGCTLDSIWSFIGGFPVGYLVGAPAFVNQPYLGVYPGGEVPTGPILLVCQRTLVLSPGDDVVARIDSQPAGAKFVFSPGVYRRVTINVRDGDTYEGQPGAILSGARVLQGFERDGDIWSIGGQRSQLEGTGGCAEFLGQSYRGCQHPEQLFLDGEVLWQVTRPGQLASGRWYFDYDANRIYMVDDPRGRLVELSDTSFAFRGNGDDVTIRGLIIEKYASRAQRGAIHGDSNNSGWLIENNEVRYNHGTGIRTNTDMVLRNNWVHHNGQIGIAGLGDRILVEGNEISFNGIAGFNPFWEAGGTKWVLTDDLVVRNNHVHNNRGRGLWTDIDNRNSLYEGNLVENNDQSGIAHEISYAATIRNNTVRNNGLSFDVWLWGAQILVQNSADTTITGNTVTVSADGGDGIAVINQNRGSGNFGKYVSEDVLVRDNLIVHHGNVGQSGVADDTSGQFSCSGAGDITFENNTYEVPDRSRNRWFWCGDLDWADIQNRGVETLGVAIES